MVGKYYRPIIDQHKRMYPFSRLTHAEILRLQYMREARHGHNAVDKAADKN